ncbi:s-cell enriched with leucine-rich repeat-containing protein slra-related [Holotrichia oblita]|uniref:S-cell enriched with leucine-rich repeat-containing protein slra-related n=1 Tax=Holotrichia oblita TaxID=644536 RepID=A0ACB9TBU0_HOLOL|nr:s-cell enriched with leucine-rich repeat-containing protein slra-related [Holotrichia oblita]
MLLATSTAPKKPQRTMRTKQVPVDFNSDSDNMEMDSLESSTFVSVGNRQNNNDINNKNNNLPNSQQTSNASTSTPSPLESSPISKRLNLNGVCLSATVLQNNNGGDESFYNIEDVLLPEESVRTLTDLQILSLKSNYMQESDLKPDNSTSLKTNILTNLNLRGNRLKGNIILGNYGNLTELDVSENNIESLDLSAVEQLQVLQCSRNNLTHLILYGKNLTSLIAGNNCITSLTVNHPPILLKHMDVSYNEMETLPDWLSGCQDLRSLFASNNNIKTLPDHLFCNEMPYLHTVQLAYNQIQYLPAIQRKLPIQELFLQNNSLSLLPENFFKAIYNIKVLNVSNNRLCDLPKPLDVLQLEKLFLTANCLNDKALEKISHCLRNLKIFHAAYNNFTSIPENSCMYWCEIEEIVFSGNKLLKLPDNIGVLRHLSVLRVHSNLLQTIPKLSNLLSLRVLDLAHNQLDRVDLTDLIPPNLKFLDLSCNIKLHVDSKQFHTYRSQRPMSLVDVSGKNRTSLPLTPSPFCENDLTASNWTVGFSETSGSKQRLYISQIRLPAFCNTEALFGMFDGENNSDMPVAVDKVVPRILLEERTVKETVNDYMKYTMLSAHRELKDKGQKHGMNAVIVHILKSKIPADYSFCGGVKKYVMKIANVGDVRVILGRASGPIRILPIKQKKQIRTNPQIHLMVPDPDVTELYLDEQYEYMIIANKNVWNVISPENAIKEVTLQRNVILAAKRLQDLAQSYGAEENLSIIVVKFNLIGSDVDLLMRELRQTIRKNKYQSESGISNTSTCQPGCCCEALHNECSNCLDKISISHNINNNHDDRSSPSGQSEQGCSDCNSAAKNYINQLNRQNENRSLRSVTPHFEAAEIKISPERRSYRGVAKALRSRREEDKSKDETDSALSEEQFKCWEYMLEQNTQMLFDKELNTLSSASKNGRRSQFSVKNPSLSRSSPHLTETNNLSFLSKHFGSTRSFNPLTSRPASRFSLDKKVMGGPHAAYFGSLQRLMPYNLEYDFAVMQERGLADSLDLDRMHQYWGVTTTEL